MTLQDNRVLLPLHHEKNHHFAAVAQMVEHQLPKLRVVGSIPICRSRKKERFPLQSPLFIRNMRIAGFFSSHIVSK